MQLPYLRIDAAARRVSLKARDPAIYRNPNGAYAALRAQIADVEPPAAA